MSRSLSKTGHAAVANAPYPIRSQGREAVLLRDDVCNLMQRTSILNWAGQNIDRFAPRPIEGWRSDGRGLGFVLRQQFGGLHIGRRIVEIEPGHRHHLLFEPDVKRLA